jgi:hypothetical protein
MAAIPGNYDPKPIIFASGPLEGFIPNDLERIDHLAQINPDDPE